MPTRPDPSTLVERAVRRLPHAERDRFAEEWRHDVEVAPDEATALQVARGARTMARRLWWRHRGLALMGRRGPTSFVAGWAIVAVVSLIAFLLGLFFWIAGACALVLTIRALLDAGVSSLAIRSIEVASLVTGTAAVAYLWWAWGAGFDAQDSFRPVPAAATHGTLAGIVLLVSGVLFVGALATSLVRRKR